MFSALANFFGGNEQEQLQKKFQEERKGSYSLSYNMSEINFDHLRRKRAFIQGQNISLMEEFDREELVGFDNLPDLLPIIPRGNIAQVDYTQLMQKPVSEESKGAAATEGEDNMFDYDSPDTAQRAAFLERFELAKKRKLELNKLESKPVAIIFNSYTTGSRQDEISGLFVERGIKSTILNCEQQMDPFTIANELEIDQFSAMIAVGGDGTFNQMINGMLARPDKKRLPVGLIPTGQSNDFARSVGLSAEETVAAIDSISKGEAIPVDTIRVLIDHDSESGLPSNQERMTHCRHMLSNASLSMPARIANGANTWKGCCGSSAFSMSTYLQMFSCGFTEDVYQLTIDDKPHTQGGVNTALMMINNGKYTNGGMIINPFAAINDGLIDITWISDPAWQGTFGVTGVMSDARERQGIQAYKGHSTYLRGKKIRIDVPLQDPEQPELELEAPAPEGSTPAAPVRQQQVIVIDGETLQYETSVTWEMFPGNVELLLSDELFLKNQTFTQQIDAVQEKERTLEDVCDTLWKKYDVDNSGTLEIEEVRQLLKDIADNSPPPYNVYDDEKAQETFNLVDTDRSGTIERHEMATFLNAITVLQGRDALAHIEAAVMK